MLHIMDSTFNGAQRVEMYRSWVFPDIYPDERPARIDNWSDEDREAYCGGEFVKV